jgi:hypothetical protein
MTNPSVPCQESIGKTRKVQIGDEKKGLIINDGTGEITGLGGAVVYEWEEVDKERFVKLFLAGVKQTTGLSKAGLTVLEVVYLQIRENPNTDRIALGFDDPNTGAIPRSVYFRGLRELLEKEFLFRSPWDGVFFVNIRYMFNGDRLAFVKAYHLKGGNGKQQKPPTARVGRISDLA